MKLFSVSAVPAARLLFAFTFGFYLSMFTRTLSNLVKHPLQVELGLSETEVSLSLGAAFFLSFALAQLPVGILLDRYDPRRINAALLLLAASGAVLMSFSQTVFALALGRCLMGFGFSAGLMASLKVYALWFPPERIPTLNSLQFMIGVLGAWSATKPVELLLRQYDWREVFLFFAALTVLAALLLLLVAPRTRRVLEDGETLAAQMQGVLGVLRDARFWRLALWFAVSLGIAQGINTLYLVPWFRDVAAMPTAAAAAAASWITLASALNFALMGPFMEMLVRRGASTLLVPVVGQCFAILLLASLAFFPEGALIPRWLAWTVCSGTSTLAFAALAGAYPARVIGRVYTTFNLIGFMVTAVCQYSVGLVLDAHTEPGAAVPAYAYSMAFGLLAGVQALAGTWFCWSLIASTRRGEQGA